MNKDMKDLEARLRAALEEQFERWGQRILAQPRNAPTAKPREHLSMREVRKRLGGIGVTDLRGRIRRGELAIIAPPGKHPKVSEEELERYMRELEANHSTRRSASGATVQPIRGEGQRVRTVLAARRKSSR